MCFTCCANDGVFSVFVDTVYMMESAHDSSSGIASDDHNGTTSSPHSTDSYHNSGPRSPHTYLGQHQHPPYVYHDLDADDEDDEMYGTPYPNKSYRTELRTHVVNGDYRERTSRQQYCLSPTQNIHHHHHRQSQSPTLTQELLYNQKNLQPPPGGAVQGMTSLDDTDNFLFDAKKKNKICYFDIVPDDIITHIFSHLMTDQLCRNAHVCRRWYNLVWEPSLWTTIRINNGRVNVDRALKVLTKKLSYDTPSVCVMVEKINLNGCEKLTDKGLNTIARRCPELRQLELQGCSNISNIAMFEIVSRCVNLEHLNVAGKQNI